MIHLLLSADYQLFMGKNFLREEDVLIAPTDKLLALCNSYEIPITLFCDYLCMQWYRKQKDMVFIQKVEAQLKTALLSGHDVQTQIHPHWPFVIRKKDSFIYPWESFLLGTQCKSGHECYQLARRYLEEAKHYFENLLKPIMHTYECIAYRAGSHGIQPYTSYIFQALKDAGYSIDSSVLPDMIEKNCIHAIDFTRFPFHSVALKGKEGGNVFEIPLAAAKLCFKDRLSLYSDYLNVAFKQLIYGSPNLKKRGLAVQIAKNPSCLSLFIKKSLQPLLSPWVPLELSSSFKAMKLTTLAYLKHLPSDNQDVFFSFRCSPKNLHEEHFLALDRYLHWLQREFSTSIKPIHYRRAHHLVSPQLSAGSYVCSIL